MALELLAALGTEMSRFIFWGSSFLTQQQAPGLVSIGILLWLLLSVVIVSGTARRRLRALRWFEAEVRSCETTEAFASGFTRISVEAQKRRDQPAHAPLVAAWDEFRETLIHDEQVDPPVLRNSVRPSSFFNLDDLHYGPGFFRYMPGLFVTVGLFLTFLGLISALQQITGLSDATPAEMRASLDGLLGAASAKFIMSLTGLLASIVFTIVLRGVSSRIDRRIHALCAQLEARLTFISLEDIASEQLNLARGQKDNFQEIGTALVAELGRSLTSELPASISASITTAMQPLFDQVGRVGTDGMGRMVDDLSKRFSEDVGTVLSKASAQLSAAGDKIGMLADRLDNSAGQMNQNMQASVETLARAAQQLADAVAGSAQTTEEKLTAGADHLLAIMNQTLDGIRANTAEGAQAMREASTQMAETAKAFREQLDAAAESGSALVGSRMEAVGQRAETAIDETARSMADTVTRSREELLTATSAFHDRIHKDLVAPIVEVVHRLDQMSQQLQAGSGQIAIAVGHIRDGGEATRGAAEVLTGASLDLQAATAPIQSGIERIESAIARLADSTESSARTVADSARHMAESAEQVLTAAGTALKAEQAAIEASLERLSVLLRDMERQRNQMDDLDETLGNAFETVTSTVQTALSSLQDHVRTMNTELTPAIDTMREIVDQAQQFKPEQRRR